MILSDLNVCKYGLFKTDTVSVYYSSRWHIGYVTKSHCDFYYRSSIVCDMIPYY